MWLIEQVMAPHQYNCVYICKYRRYSGMSVFVSCTLNFRGCSSKKGIHQFESAITMSHVQTHRSCCLHYVSPFQMLKLSEDGFSAMETQHGNQHKKQTTCKSHEWNFCTSNFLKLRWKIISSRDYRRNSFQCYYHLVVLNQTLQKSNFIFLKL